MVSCSVREGLTSKHLCNREIAPKQFKKGQHAIALPLHLAQLAHERRVWVGHLARMVHGPGRRVGAHTVALHQPVGHASRAPTDALVAVDLRGPRSAVRVCAHRTQKQTGRAPRSGAGE
eukprot:3742006-Prymnesium_polylepis.1